MSNATSDNAGAGRRRRRSRGGRNRNRQNDGNKNHHRERNDTRSRQGSQGDRSRRRSGGRRPEPVKLTWWQKLLKAIGLYKEPARPPRPQKGDDAPVKSNTRVARTRGKDRPAGKSSGPEPIEPHSTRLYLGNLSYEATESDLEELFKGVGTVRRVEIVYNRRTHRSKGYGFVDMLAVDEAKRAVEVLHDQFFMGRRLVVSGAKSDGPNQGDDDDNSDDLPEPADPAAPTA